jgi:hypothetical protein
MMPVKANLLYLRSPRKRGQQEEALKPQLALQHVGELAIGLPRQQGMSDEES